MNIFERFRDGICDHPGWINSVVVATLLIMWWPLVLFVLIREWFFYDYKQMVLVFKEDVLNQLREPLWDYWESKQ